jgi:lysophospholipase L1-like esterase
MVGPPLRTTSDPLRVVVLGSSVGYFLRPHRTTLEQRTYAEHLQVLLRRQEIPVEVRNASSWTLLVPEAVQRLEELVLRAAPDVVVVNLGIVDCEPRTIPLRLLRWLFSKSPSGAGISHWTRRVFAPPLYRAYTAGSPRLLKLMPMPPRVLPKRFERETRMLAEIIRQERGALVLLVGIPRPGDRLEEVLPGTRANASRFNAILRDVADEPGVRFVGLEHSALTTEELVPDGIHFSPEGHLEVADLLAVEIADWWGEQHGLDSSRA